MSAAYARLTLCTGRDHRVHVSPSLIGTHINRAETLCGQNGLLEWLYGDEPPVLVPPCMDCLRLAVWKIQGVLLW